LLLAALLALSLSACQPADAPQSAPQPPSVGVIAVAEMPINPFYEFVGKTRAAETVALRARVTGFLQERRFQEGGLVEAGQVLFKIEPDQYAASLAQTQAALAAAEASLNRAQVDLERYRELVASKNVSQQKVDEAEAEVRVQQAAVETAEADVEKAALNLDYTEIVAPINGRIDRAAFDVGNLVGPESGVLATINRMDPIHVTFSIAETAYLELAQDDRAVQSVVNGAAAEFDHVPLIRLPDGSLYGDEGRFDFIDNKVDEATGTVLVRAEFPNPDGILLPGQFVTVVIERKDAIDAVTLPQAAVLTDQGGRYVLVVDEDGRVATRRIEIGQEFGPNLQVKSGLEPGERVILYGIQKVRPGIAVIPEPAAAPSDPGQAASGDVGGSDAAGSSSSGSLADGDRGGEMREERTGAATVEETSVADGHRDSAADPGASSATSEPD
jgi:membrane fusion protein (multidrug efflux system)